MAQHYEVVISAEAEDNILAAFSWIEEINPTAAQIWYDGLIEATQSLCTLPQRCPIAPESKLGFVDREVRQLLYGSGYWKYRILFVVGKNRIEIAHVRHGARLYLGQAEVGGE